MAKVRVWVGGMAKRLQGAREGGGLSRLAIHTGPGGIVIALILVAIGANWWLWKTATAIGAFGVFALWLALTPGIARVRFRWPAYLTRVPSEKEARALARMRDVRERLAVVYRSRSEAAFALVHRVVDDLAKQLEQREEPYRSVGELLRIGILSEASKATASLEMHLEGLDAANLPNLTPENVEELNQFWETQLTVEKLFQEFWQYCINYRTLRNTLHRLAYVADIQLETLPDYERWKARDTALRMRLAELVAPTDMGPLRDSLVLSQWEEY